MLRAPAAGRNKEPILGVLRTYLPDKDGDKSHAKALEVASGTGQHVAHFAQHLPHVIWHPSDVEQSHLNSISAHRQAGCLNNICEPIYLDMMAPSPLSGHSSLEPLESFDLIYNANMVHISPWGTAVGLFHTAGKLLKSSGVLFMYGPFRINGDLSPESNVRFDAGLRSQNPSWGVRDIKDLNKLATENGFVYEQMVDMPSNNKCLIYRKNE